MTRRRWMGAATALAALLGAGRGVALGQQKAAQKMVQYQPKPKGDQRCSGCLHFVAPDQCKLVTGPISPDGWCSLFAPKPKR